MRNWLLAKIGWLVKLARKAIALSNDQHGSKALDSVVSYGVSTSSISGGFGHEGGISK